MSADPQRCGSCGALVHFLTNTRTFKLAPIEAEPSPIGNCAVDLVRGVYEVLGPAMVRETREREQDAKLYLNHFSMCPQARVWAKGGNRHATKVSS